MSAKKAAKRKPENPIILLDGEELIDYCISNVIGFVYKPIFSKNNLKKFYKKETSEFVNNLSTEDNNVLTIEKQITANDIRARIIGIPITIYYMLPEDKTEFNLIINDVKLENVRINRARKYFSKGISVLYRECSLITEDNVYNPCNAFWSYEGGIIRIEIDYKK